MASDQEEERSAADRVFDTVELAELIFTNLPLDSVTKVMRTCKHFNSIVKSSKTVWKGLHWFKSSPERHSNHSWLDVDKCWEKRCGRSKPHLSFSHPFTPGRPFFYMGMATREGWFRYVIRPEPSNHSDKTHVIKVSDSGTEPRWRKVRICEDDSRACVRVCSGEIGSEFVEKVLPSGATLGDLYDFICEAKAGLTAS